MAFGVAAPFLVRVMLRDGPLAWERPLLACAPLLPAFAVDPKPSIGPVIWWIVLGRAWQRDAVSRGGRLSPAVPAPCGGT